MLRNHKQSGFTLIELMIVVVIVGILITVALPSFQSQAVRTNQAAAQSAMMDIANVQEQYFLATRSYLDKAALEATGYTLDPDVANNYTYTMTVAAGPPSTFLLTLVPSSSAGGDATFTINSSGNKTPAEYWDR